METNMICGSTIIFLYFNYIVYSSAQITTVAADNTSSNGENDFSTTTEFLDYDDVNNSTFETTEASSDKNVTDSLKNDITNCSNTNCVRKCCPKGMFMLTNCQPLEDGMEDWVPAIPNYTFLYGFPPASNPNISCYLHDSTEVELLPTGNVTFKIRDVVLSTDDYCFEKGKNESYLQAAVCYGKIVHSSFELYMDFVQKITMGFSIAFLFVLIVIHVAKLKMSGKVHEKCFLSMCTALFLSFFSLLFIQLEIIKKYNHSTCVMIAMFVQYFSLAFNFWLNIRCYETFRIIRGTVKAIPISMLNSSRHRFLKYSAWCWGLPAIISVFTVIMQTLPAGVLESYRPNIGDGKCWFPEKILILYIYFYGFQLFLHILNILFLGMSFFMLFRSGEMKCCIGKKSGEDKVRTYNRKGLNMFWQQFFIFLFYIFLLSFDSISVFNPRATPWHYIDVINTLQGVYLFVIFFVSSKNRRKLLIDAYNYTSSLAKSISTSLTPQSSVTSNQKETSGDNIALTKIQDSGKSNEGCTSDVSTERSS